MSIRPLPQAAVRLIGSAQTLTDSASVVKELIDNAIDARATSISIEISSNTLDLIQVRDNGHGIAPDDRAMVAKRYCTSKIKDHHDLSNIGGSYLGFRGEALNSVAEMSGAMTVITRVDGEDMATSMKILPNGELSGEERASHPVGTTIRIANFLDRYPVRKQTGLKGAARALAKIKQYLLGYAFARPTLRLALRVTKAKSDRDNWTYAPSVSESIEQTSSRIVGRHCASQCSRFEYKAKGYRISSLLPRAECDRTKISGIGQYFSVDGRPVSASKGIFKQVVKIFKGCLQKSTVTSEDIKDPFMYLDLSCPEGSYDPNIEPAKDDVLFAEIDTVLKFIRDFLDSVYPLVELAPVQSGPSCMDQYDAGLEPAMGTSPRVQVPALEQTYRSNTYDSSEEDLTFLSEIAAGEADSRLIDEDDIAEPDILSGSWSNPWVMAKMNGRTGKTNLGHPLQSQLVTPAREPTAHTGTHLSSSPMVQDAARIAHQTASSRVLPTPRASSVICGSDDNDPQAFSDMSDRVLGPRSLLEQTPDTPAPAIHRPLPRAQPFNDMHLHTPQRSRNSPMSHTVDPSGIPLDEIPETSQRSSRPSRKPRQAYVNKPFKPPVAPERDAWFHIPEAARDSITHARRARPKQSQRPAFIPRGDPPDSSLPRPLSPPANNTDIRNFITAQTSLPFASEANAFTVNPAPDSDTENTAPEAPHRPPALNRSFVRASDLAQDHGIEQPDHAPIINRAAPRRRKTSERTALQDIDNNIVDRDDDDANDEANDDASYDPKYRRASSNKKRKRTSDDSSSNKAKRTVSSRWPLEHVPLDLQIQNLVLCSDVTEKSLATIWRSEKQRPSHLLWCEAAEGVGSVFEGMCDREVGLCSEKLDALLRERFPGAEERMGDFASEVRSAFERFRGVEGELERL